MNWPVRQHSHSPPGSDNFRLPTNKALHRPGSRSGVASGSVFRSPYPVGPARPGSRLSISSRTSVARHGSLSLDRESAADGVSPSVGSIETSTIHTTSSLSTPGLTFCSRSHRPRSGDPSAEKGHLTGHRPQIPGFLLPTFRSSESHRRISSSTRLVSTERVSETHLLSHGHNASGSSEHASERLVCVSGLDRCILPCSHSPSRPEVAQVCLEQSGLSVQRSAVRTESVPMGFHPCSQRTDQVGSLERHQNALTHGRLASSQPESLLVHGSAEPGSVTGTTSGVPDSPPEVRVNSPAVIHLPGHSVQYSGLVGTTGSKEGFVPSCQDSSSVCAPHGDVTTDSVSSGRHGIYGLLTSPSTSLQKTATEGISTALLSVSTELEHAHAHTRLVQSCSPTVARPQLDPPVSAPDTSRSLARGVRGCVTKGVGGTPVLSDSQRPMVGTGSGFPHQLPGAQGSQESPRSLPAVSQQRPCPDMVRQQDCCFVDQTSGGHSLSLPLTGSGIVAPMGSQSGLDPDIQTCQRQSECHGRPSESSRLDPSNRVDSFSLSASSHLAEMGQAHVGSVRHPVLDSTSGLCVSGTGRQRMGSRRSEYQLERAGSVRVSSVQVDSGSTTESTIRSAQTHSHSPAVAGHDLVQHATRDGTRTSCSPERECTRYLSTKIRHRSRKSDCAQSERIPVMRRALQGSGLSEEAIMLNLSAQRKSTKSVYQNHWVKWAKWCKEHSVKPLYPSAVDIANHLAFVHSTYKVSAAYLRVRRSAITSTMASVGNSGIAQSPIITNVLKGIALQSVKDKKRLPAWDVRAVLSYLLSASFEPLSQASLKNLTMKTCFLVALASGRRASEILAFSGIPGDLAFEKDGSISLAFLPEFLAKNQNPQDISPNVSIKRLDNFCGPKEPDAQNCPVRALKMYRKKTQTMRSPNQRCLFISYNPSMAKDIRVSTISRWLRTLIIEAYKFLDKQSVLLPAPIPLSSPRAHETRAWASTLALRSVPLSQLLQAGYWRSEDVFINHYLRDVSRRKEDGTWGLPAVVAAQTTVPRTGK